MLGVCKQLLLNNFKIFLCLSVLLGYFLPFADYIPSELVIILTAGIIFVTCFSVQKRDLSKTDATTFVRHYIVRFVLLGFVCSFLLPILELHYVIALTLLACMPAGVTSPAFTSIYKGNVSLALMLVVVTTLLCPLTIPLVVNNLIGSKGYVQMDVLFITLSLSIFLPLLLHLPFRKINLCRTHFVSQGDVYTILFTLVNMAVSVAKSKQYLFTSFSLFLFLLFLTASLFLLFYILSWKVSKQSPFENRIAYTLASGAQNTGLAIALSLLYFPANVTAVLLIAVIPWTLGLVPFEYFIIKRQLRR